MYRRAYVRKQGRGTTSITIEKLGNIEEVRAKAGGKDPYIWTQEYVDELNRREYEEQKEIKYRNYQAKIRQGQIDRAQFHNPPKK